MLTILKPRQFRGFFLLKMDKTQLKFNKFQDLARECITIPVYKRILASIKKINVMLNLLETTTNLIQGLKGKIS